MIVEILARRGRVTERHRIDRLPATIGRAYDNDVILDDRHVDARHAKIRDSEGSHDGWWIEDVGSVNGLSVGGRRVERTAIRSGDEVRIGRTRLRVVADDHPVPPALPAGINDSPRNSSRSLVVCLVSIAAAFLVAAVGAYLDRFHDVTFSEVVAGVLPKVLVIALWAGAWAFANRVLAQVPNFFAHAAIASAGSVAISLVGTLSGYANFIFIPSITLSVASGYVVDALLLSALLYAHLSLLSSAKSLRRALSAVLVAFGMLGVVNFSSLALGHRYSGGFVYAGELKPVATNLLATTSGSEFIDSLGDLRERVDELAQAARAASHRSGPRGGN